MTTFAEDSLSWRVANASHTEAERIRRLKVLAGPDEMSITLEDMDFTPEEIAHDSENWTVITEVDS